MQADTGIFLEVHLFGAKAKNRYTFLAALQQVDSPGNSKGFLYVAANIRNSHEK